MSYMITLHFKRMYILLYTVCKHCLRGGYTFGVTFVSLGDIDEGKSLVSYIYQIISFYSISIQILFFAMKIEYWYCWLK